MKKIDFSVFKSRRFKHGSMATMLTVFFIVAVVIVNVIVNMLLERFPVSVDLTSNKVFELSDESIKLAKAVNTDIKITVCSPKEDIINLSAGGQQYGKQAVELLKQYQTNNPKIKVEYIDLLKNPEFNAKYPDEELTSLSIIVESEKRTKVLSLDQFIEVTQSTQGQSNYSSSAEKTLTTSLSYVSDDKLVKAVVLTGHSEDDASSITSLLESNNYEVEEQNIKTEDINTEASIAILVSPNTDYTEEELKKLDSFLDNDGKFGKTLVYVSNFNQKSLPNLQSFLAEWGIEVGSGIVVETDTKNIYDQYGSVFGVNIADETYKNALSKQDLPLLASRPRPIKTTFTEDGNRTAKVLLNTNDSTIIIPTGDEQKDFDIQKAEKSSQSIAVLGSRTKYDGTTSLVSNVIAFGGIEMFAPQLTADASLNNNDFTVTTINKLSGKEESVNISSVSFDAEKLQGLTLQKYEILKFVFTIVVPLITLILSIVIWIRRRNR